MSGRLFTFHTAAFIDGPEALAERVNDTVGGHALATWLSDELKKAGVEASPPWHEDHGCDFDAVHDGRRYLCVCSVEEDENGAREAHVLIGHTRSLGDRLMGRNTFDAGAAIFAIAHDLLARHPDVIALTAEETR